MENTVLFAGTANRALAPAIAKALGLTLGACRIEGFPDGEVAVQLHQPVHQQTVYLLQSTSPHGLFIAGTRTKLSHPSIQRIYVTDTITPPEPDWPQLPVVSVAPLLAAALRRFGPQGFLSPLF